MQLCVTSLAPGPCPAVRVPGAPQPPLLLLLLLTLCPVYPRVTVACFLWPWCPAHMALGPHAWPLGGPGQAEEAGTVSLRWDVRTHRHPHSLSTCSNAFLIVCTWPHAQGQESENSRLSHVGVAAYPCEQLQNYLNFYCFFA